MPIGIFRLPAPSAPSQDVRGQKKSQGNPPPSCSSGPQLVCLLLSTFQSPFVFFSMWYWGFPMVLSGRVRNSVYFPFSWKQKSYVHFLKVSLRRKKCFKERVSSSSWGFQCERPWNSHSGGPPGKQTTTVRWASTSCHPSVAVKVLRHSCTWKTREIEHSILRWLEKVPHGRGSSSQSSCPGWRSTNSPLPCSEEMHCGRFSLMATWCLPTAWHPTSSFPFSWRHYIPCHFQEVWWMFPVCVALGSQRGISASCSA